MKPDRSVEREFWICVLVVMTISLACLIGQEFRSRDDQSGDVLVVGSEPRSAKWPAVRKQHLGHHPICEACGSGEDLNVHHVKPFHTNPELELNPENLVTLCRGHHLEIGHDADGPWGPLKPNWSESNPNVRADAARMWRKLNPKGP